MKYTKTTIRELSARYRGILKKCFLLNALAMGLIVATAANAATTTDVTFSGKYNSGAADVGSSPAGTTYEYTNYLGLQTGVLYSTDPTGFKYQNTSGALVDFDPNNLPDATDYGVTSTANNTTVKLKSDVSLYAGVTASADNYQFFMTDANGDSSWVDSDTTLTALSKTYESTYLTGENAVTVTSGSATPVVDIANYKKEAGGLLYELKYDSGTDTYSLEAEGIDVSGDNPALLTVLKTNYLDKVMN